MDCRNNINNLSNESDDYFYAGRQVKIINNKTYVKQYQTNNGGWTESMEKYVGQTVTVIGMDFDKLVKVTTKDKQTIIVTKLILQSVTDDRSNENDLQPQKSQRSGFSVMNKLSFLKLSKPDKSVTVNKFLPNEIVKVNSNKEFVKLKQKNKGEYSEKRMAPLLGKKVRVIIQKLDFVIVEYKKQQFDMHADVLSKVNINSESPKSSYSSQETTIPSSSNEEPSIPSSSNKEPSIPSSSNKDSYDLLIAAIKSNNKIEVLEHIEEQNINKKDKYGHTPLNIACRRGCSYEIIEELLECGADHEAVDNSMYSPLHHCCLNGILENVKTLINYSEVTKKYFFSISCNRNNLFNIKNPITLAEENGHEDIAAFLIHFTTFETSNSDILIDMSLPDIPTDNGHLILKSNQEKLSTNYANETILPNDTNGLVSMDKSSRGQCLDELNNSKKKPFETLTIPSNNSRPSAPGTLENQNIDSKRIIECKICYTNVIDTTFDCGHTCCNKCAEKLLICHMCMRDIGSKNTLYL